MFNYPPIPPKQEHHLHQQLLPLNNPYHLHFNHLQSNQPVNIPNYPNSNKHLPMNQFQQNYQNPVYPLEKNSPQIIVIQLDKSYSQNYETRKLESQMPAESVSYKCHFCNYYGKTVVNKESNGCLLFLIGVCLVTGVFLLPLLFLFCLIPAWGKSRITFHRCYICRKEIGIGR